MVSFGDNADLATVKKVTESIIEYLKKNQAEGWENLSCKIRIVNKVNMS